MVIIFLFLFRIADKALFSNINYLSNFSKEIYKTEKDSADIFLPPVIVTGRTLFRVAEFQEEDETAPLGGGNVWIKYKFGDDRDTRRYCNILNIFCSTKLGYCHMNVL